MKYCRNCKFEFVDEEFIFCPYCRSELEGFKEDKVSGLWVRVEMAEIRTVVDPQVSEQRPDEVDVTYKGVTFKVPIKNDVSYGLETL